MAEQRHFTASQVCRLYEEISYVHSEAYASGELKHGTISLIEDGTLVVALGTYGKLFAKAMSNVVEVKSRGASVLALTTYPHQEEMARTADVVMTIPDIHALLLPILGVVPLHHNGKIVQGAQFHGKDSLYRPFFVLLHRYALGQIPPRREACCCVGRSRFRSWQTRPGRRLPACGRG